MKETEIGDMPDSWEVVEIGDVFKFTSGKTKPKDTSRTPSEYLNIPVYGGNGVLGYSSQHLLDESTLILGRVGEYCGCAHMTAQQSWVTDNALYVKDEKRRVNHQFMRNHFEYLNLNRYSNKMGQPLITQGIINKVKFALPPLPEQKKIAHILSTVQRAIEAQERIIQTTAELKKALMQKLFTEGLRNEPQKQTEIGLVPESWEMVELGNLAKIERGKFSHRPRNEPRFYGGVYPFVQTGDVSNCDGHIRAYTQTLNEDGLAISKMFPAGTILITIAANIGYTGILEFDSACPDSLIGITPSDRIQTEFLNYYLMTQQPKMDRIAPRGTQKNINIQFLKPWLIVLPSIKEQDEISVTLKATDAKIRLALRKRDELKDLLRTLLHELMTAKIRVHKVELTELPAGAA